MSLYENIRKRQRAGISRSKKKSTIDPKIYSMMTKRQGGFADKKKEKA